MAPEKEVTSVRLQNATLDEKGDMIVAHGWLDLEALDNLRVGDYQREILDYTNRGGGKLSAIEKGLRSGARLPDIFLGMRGQKYTARGAAMLLEDDVYIIDGLQRVSAIKKFAAQHPELAKDMRIGAEVRFSTTRDSERDLFTVLNTQRKAMSPNVLLRNARSDSHGLLTVFGLTQNDKDFPLYGKVCWNQQMGRNEVITALIVCRSISALHSYFGPGKLGGNAHALPKQMDALAKKVSLKRWRENIQTFFEAVDEIWGLRGIKYKDKQTHTRMTFLITLATLIADHENFWEDTKLVIDGPAKAKLKTFPMDDPTIMRLAAAGSTGGLLLYGYMRDHMNKSKRVNQLVARRRTSVPKYKVEIEAAEEDEAA